MGLEALLGDKVVNQKGDATSVKSVSENNDVIGLYFSAHWCPPCRAFTPVLSQYYKKLQADGKKIEIVFVSSDRSEEQFNEYFNEMPWLSLPYADRDRKAKLGSKFKVQGIPTLVLLDAKTGKTITVKGRGIVERPTSDFPFKPPSIKESLGKTFLKHKADGTVETVSEEALKGKTVGLYFSAHWCPPCKMFTPAFASVYKKVAESNPGKFETVFVSSDKDESSFTNYHKEMPWLAVPFTDRSRAQQLSELFDVEGIPSLAIIDYDSGEVINKSARGSISSDPEGKQFPWKPELVADLEASMEIQDVPHVVIMAEGESKARQQELKETLLKIAKSSQSKSEETDDELKFAVGTIADGIAKRIRDLTKLGPAEKVAGDEDVGQRVVCEGDVCRMIQVAKGDKLADTRLLIIDIPDQGGFYLDDSKDPLTSDTILDFVNKYRSGKLKDQRKQLGN